MSLVESGNGVVEKITGWQQPSCACPPDDTCGERTGSGVHERAVRNYPVYCRKGPLIGPWRVSRKRRAT
jgi:hypothetical protein